MSHQKFIAKGVIPATLLAFNEDLSIDEVNTRKHVKDVASVRGVNSIVVNGHASEVHACTFDEQRRLIEVALNEVGDKTAIVSGIYADGSRQAADLARMAHDAGASALLVFPSASFWMGAMNRPEMIKAHFQAVVDSSDLPIVLFQYAAVSPISYPAGVIEQLVDQFPTIVGVKDASNDPQTHEYLTRTLHARSKPVTMFSSHSAWLLGSLAMGADGILSGAGSVLAALHVELYEAIKRNDLEAARATNDRIYTMVRVFYAHPHVDMHNRMKEALAMMGKIDRAVVRPPLVKLKDDELGRIRQALVNARLIGA